MNNKSILESKDVKFQYMMVSRLWSDIQDYKNYKRERNEQMAHLYCATIEKQFDLLKKMYKALPITPKWLRYKEILKNEFKLINKINNRSW
jgi:hypothetical protein